MKNTVGQSCWLWWGTFRCSLLPKRRFFIMQKSSGVSILKFHVGQEGNKSPLSRESFLGDHVTKFCTFSSIEVNQRRAV